MNLGKNIFQEPSGNSMFHEIKCNTLPVYFLFFTSITHSFICQLIWCLDWMQSGKRLTDENYTSINCIIFLTTSDLRLIRFQRITHDWYQFLSVSAVVNMTTSTICIKMAKPVSLRWNNIIVKILIQSKLVTYLNKCLNCSSQNKHELCILSARGCMSLRKHWARMIV